MKISEFDVKRLAIERLRDLSLIAYDMHQRNQQYTAEDMSNVFTAINDVFGDSEASGFLNECLLIHAKNLKTNKNQRFPDSVCETLAVNMKAMNERLDNIK